MRVVIDMNLSPAWVPVLRHAGHEALHWSDIGAANATDHEILSWAQAREFVVLTHDLDFGAILAATKAEAPSVLQVRSANPTPEHCGRIVLHVLSTHEAALMTGVLVSADESSARVRMLPLNRS
jgi:predicted nuclease of predicted toxin-antitoxin system